MNYAHTWDEPAAYWVEHRLEVPDSAPTNGSLHLGRIKNVKLNTAQGKGPN